MPAYNFKSEFSNAVTQGVKCTTIRQRRKRPTMKGDTLFLYSGLRTKKAWLLTAVECLNVLPFEIRVNDEFVLNSRVLNVPEMRELARMDTAGLWSLSMFINFFDKTYGLPFTGELIVWKPHKGFDPAQKELLRSVGLFDWNK